MHGCCYWFAWILNERFGLDIVYEPVEGHFLAMDMPDANNTLGHLYDVRGDVTGLYEGVVIYSMDVLSVIEPNWHRRLLLDCRDMNNTVEYLT